MMCTSRAISWCVKCTWAGEEAAEEVRAVVGEGIGCGTNAGIGPIGNGGEAVGGRLASSTAATTTEKKRISVLGREFLLRVQSPVRHR